MRFLNRIQVGSLKVLNESQFEGVEIFGGDNHRGDCFQVEHAAGTETALTGDQLKPIGIDRVRSDKNRLKNPVKFDRCRKIRQGFFIEKLPWLIIILVDPIRRQLLKPDSRRCLFGHLRQESGQTTTE